MAKAVDLIRATHGFPKVVTLHILLVTTSMVMARPPTCARRDHPSPKTRLTQ